jgi:LmbE family N-acetylglucosaminyl deacetylase
VITVAAFFAMHLFRCLPVHAAGHAPLPGLALDPNDRILVLAPHPDDEILACGGIIQKAVAMKLPVRVVFFTYGDNNEWSFLVYRKHLVVTPGSAKAMGAVRHDEALAADAVLGLAPGDLIFLGYPDFRTLNIWYDHWGANPPARSMLTRVQAVPYATAFRPGAPYKGEEIVKDLESLMREFKPTKVFVSHPGDHNPDHSALYLFTRVALWDLESEMKPALYPYLVHLKHWPKPGGYRPADPLEPPQFLQSKIPWETSPLKPVEVEGKHAAIGRHKSQFEIKAKYLLSFVRTNELFGDFPPVTMGDSTLFVPLSLPSKESSSQIPKELTKEEQASFTILEQHFLRFESGRVVLSVRLSRPLVKEAKASVYIFGYRPDVPFAQMPKLDIRFTARKHSVYDQDRAVSEDGIQVERNGKEITLSVPVEVLGKPKRVLVSARTYLGETSFDWASWRVLELP